MIEELKCQVDIPKTDINSEILKYCRDAHNKFNNFLKVISCFLKKKTAEAKLKWNVKNYISRDMDMKEKSELAIKRMNRETARWQGCKREEDSFN